jgi:hypothetical protein
MVTSDALVTRQDQSLSVIAVSQVEVEVALTSMFHPNGTNAPQSNPDRAPPC